MRFKNDYYNRGEVSDTQQAQQYIKSLTKNYKTKLNKVLKKIKEFNSAHTFLKILYYLSRTSMTMKSRIEDPNSHIFYNIVFQMLKIAKKDGWIKAEKFLQYHIKNNFYEWYEPIQEYDFFLICSNDLCANNCQYVRPNSLHIIK